LSAVRIERVTAISADRMADIHADCFARPWSQIEMASMLHLSSTIGLLLYQVEQPLGLSLMRLAVDDAEILTIGIAPTARKLGLGRGLLTASEAAVLQGGARRLFLEVSINNHAASALYSQAGYSEIGRRRAYYADGSDAIVLEKALYEDGQAPC
jgi:ribosomal-protein-alanine N-acetyltransferase